MLSNLSTFFSSSQFPICFPDFGGKDFSKLFWDAGNISGIPKHNLLCSLEHKNKIGKTGEFCPNFKYSQKLLILDGWLHITNSSITQPTIQPHDHPISQTFLHSLNQSVGNIYYGNNRQTKVDGRRSLTLNFGTRQK